MRKSWQKSAARNFFDGRTQTARPLHGFGRRDREENQGSSMIQLLKFAICNIVNFRTITLEHFRSIGDRIGAHPRDEHPGF